MESYTGTKHTGHDDIQQYNDTESVKSNHKDNLAQNTNTQQISNEIPLNISIYTVKELNE
jgi:hypothetical protein